jgi:hypothetical protein
MTPSRVDLTGATWRSSTHSDGGGNCVEVAEGFPWRTSSYSDGGGDCVEVADGFPQVVPVRDSKNPGPVLVVPADAWAAFIGSLRV